ncbi:response regulator transcription factor [Thalassotalea sp. HSM 43]|uniref:response regulator n=1 Tax=Thalassotalea sp. HSM 43 TaxID=2552945 RepID=UPI001081BDA3|nr:response regulator transcription factor [Thalassotalea sp. HSM 43]QBY02954.1 response regulator transcription factor [Thalassotalea sp. HSM 43]
MTIGVLLVDDQALVRAGIKSLLDLSEEVSVIAEASDGSQIIGALESHEIDVILLDISMPVMNGIEALALLKQQNIATPVIILTTFDDHDLILKGIANGAKGYLLKDVSLDTLIDAIKSVHAGQRLVQPAITERLLSGMQHIRSDFEKPDMIEPLSIREKEVLSLMASGCSNKEIADMLCKSQGTIKNHVSNVLSKLGVRDRTRAVLLAIEKGLI